MSYTFDDFTGDMDTDSVEPSKGRGGPLPVGDYTLALDTFEFKQTKDGTGMIFAATFKVVEGDHEGRLVFSNFNIANKNETAQRIGIADVKALCVACGLDWSHVRRDPPSLLHRPFIARVGLEKPREGFEQRNEIKKYYPAGQVPPSAGAPQQQPAGFPPAQQQQRPASPPPQQGAPTQQQQRPALGGGFPWKR